MTGLDKIIGQINKESDETAAAITAQANSQAEEIINNAREEADKECADIAASAQHKADADIARAHSAASLAIGKELLAEKNRLISEVFQKAQDYIDSLPDSEYFALLKDMVKKYAIPGKSGEIRFNKKDLGRLPEGFADEISAIVGAAGGKITVSDKTEKIRSGFILDYGGIEENCSVSALINESRESLQDQIQKILFK
ncbi:MAG: V-type ATP synthase subunit E [Lachnospiraceae bacterium]|jgi:V/A-type H+-transporting ATPase subunit E